MSELWETELDEALYRKYIKPTQRRRQPYVGVEFELPVVNLGGQAVDFAAVHALTDAFVKQFGFDKLSRDDDGDVYLAQRTDNGDGLSYDCSYNTLELSFGVETDLNVIYARFVQYYSFIQDFLKQYNHTLTGMGINPHYRVNRNEPIHNGRYRMLYHHLSSYKKYGNAIPFHHHPNFGLFSCASQVQLDVEEDQIAETFNAFTKLEPLKSIIFANSIWGKHSELLCGRDQFWRNSLHGLNRHNVDMYNVKFDSSQDVLSYIKSMSIYCVERDDKYINFAPTLLEEYFAADSITGEYYDGSGYSSITFAPRTEDLDYLRSFKFEDLTYRGTVEFRSVCTQPVRDIMTTSAFHTGLLENRAELAERLHSDTAIYHKGYNASELRNLFNHREFPKCFDRDAVSALLTDVLDIAKDGLQRRGLHEEHFLEPLYERAKHLSSPARIIAEGLDAGGDMEQYIINYASL